jgi:hypothetical protein
LKFLKLAGKSSPEQLDTPSTANSVAFGTPPTTVEHSHCNIDAPLVGADPPRPGRRRSSLSDPKPHHFDHQTFAVADDLDGDMH